MVISAKWAACAVLWTACATSSSDDIAGADGGTKDAPLRADAEIFYDARPQVDAYRAPDGSAALGFNQPCGDRSECTSGLCLESGAGGYCTETCAGETCPPGFGCLGVNGIAEPHMLTFVCVRQSNLLCSPCMSSAECAASSYDLCLPSAAGGSFCARDCSTIDCPGGYLCQQVAVGDAGTAKQCVPMSGACDCNASLAGMTKACSLQTPFGTTCAATRTCLGSAGWGDCTPPAKTDVPDGNFADENCDGIDGTVTDGVFVATPSHGGLDSDTCGTSGDPCATISKGARRALLGGKHTVFVQAGTYAETVVMTDGVSIYGGYDTTWQRADRTRPGHEVTIVGQLYTDDLNGADQYVAVAAHQLTKMTILADVTLSGANAMGSSQRSGRSSYGVQAFSANLRIERVTINAGAGAPGATGALGMDAPNPFVADGMGGKTGGNASQGVSCCDTTSAGAGGDPGTNTCADHGGDDPTPGKGGKGGTKDSNCPWYDLCAGDATDGIDGSAAKVAAADMYGYGGTHGVAHAANGDDLCSVGGPGGAGLITNGAPGMGGVAGGRILNGYWYAFPGQDGGVGKNGGGGGGGGGSSGCDSGTDSYGAGGGGGGAGGCAALTGGGGGEGGGGSFGVFAVQSTLVLRDVIVQQGSAGKGGDGGNGGRGQSGGGGAAGGMPAGGSKDGGAGGKGGHGGHGAGGGGGAGGVSFGLFTSQSTVDRDASTVINVGSISVAPGGGPGASAPNAPIEERDGNPGTPGAQGANGTTYDCAAPAHC
jgi:hypothetical protein